VNFIKNLIFQKNPNLVENGNLALPAFHSHPEVGFQNVLHARPTREF
jgi:hypothetical protein